MRTLHAYLTRQVLAALVMTAIVFTFVLLLGSVLKEVLALLVNRQAEFSTLALSVALLVPWVLSFALPMGMLTATLLVFGRFSADQELTAVRASGVSLLTLITPVLLLGVGLSGLCAWINLEVAPASRVAYKRILFSAGTENLSALLPERTFIKDFPGRIIYVGKVRGSELKDIHLYKLDEEGRVEFFVRASEGTLRFNVTNRQVNVLLRDAWHVGLHEGKRVPVFMGEFEFMEQLVPESARRQRLSEMTFLQLRQELRDLERRLSAPNPRGAAAPEEWQRWQRELQRQRGDLTEPIRVQMHRQVALSFACIGFTLVGIPLGIRAHRRETTFGIAIALVLVLVYYSFFILAQALETRADLYPHLLQWAPNFLFQALGAVWLWRANRGI